MDKTQRIFLQMLVDYATETHEEAEEAEYSDTEELWHIIKMFSGAISNLLDHADDVSASAVALEELMDQLTGVGLAIEDEDCGQWHGSEGLSFAQARAAIALAKGA